MQEDTRLLVSELTEVDRLLARLEQKLVHVAEDVSMLKQRMGLLAKGMSVACGRIDRLDARIAVIERTLTEPGG
ncbi:MAG TPA: hypothetical protein VEA80_10130 [Vitreimonas sp.]|uniref:hypothetical protein n=1 Tax=Vitreimonas sp. TaxID=3069702 RepID=UPI002D363A34|nr:hypothetical protein [Vitreimonas sp.]HYD87822.1 hypothetical protein [Vitreimonas sp.]